MSFETGMCRLHDLVRYQRSELHEAGLISDDEYAQLAQDHSAVARLATYDSMKAQIAALQSEVAILKESNKSYQRTAQAILEIKMERDALREALKYARRFLEANEVDLSFIDSVLFPASGEPARKP